MRTCPRLIISLREQLLILNKLYRRREILSAIATYDKSKRNHEDGLFKVKIKFIH